MLQMWTKIAARFLKYKQLNTDIKEQKFLIWGKSDSQRRFCAQTDAWF